MPFKSYEELINMSKQDPGKARRKVIEARKKNRPVVSENNPGYGSKYPKSVLEKRMQSVKNTESAEEESVSKRKKVGY